MTKKQKKSLLLICISALLFFVCKLLPYADWFGTQANLAETLFFLVPFLVAGLDIVCKAVRNLFGGRMLDENFLMTIATVGAFCLGEGSEGAMVVLLYRVGELFESYATERSRKSIQSLMDITPEFANLEQDGKTVQIDPDKVRIGDIILVKAGEKIPLDGRVLTGESSLNTAALTGESLPLHVTIGDRVISGSINLSGVLRIEVESEYADSTVGKIVELIENAAAKKAKTENFITRFAAIYTPAVVAAALLLGLLPPLLGAGSFASWIERALTFLVISCPCALVISVPLSFFGGMGCASKRGILVKGATYLEQLSKMKTCLFDKTGTLTKGSFHVTAIHPETVTEAELLRIAAAVECYSDHPISVSLVAAYGRKPDLPVEQVKELAGAGVCALLDGKEVLVGNDKLMQQAGIAAHNCHLTGTTVHIALDGVYMGHIIIADEIKDSAAETIHALQQAGIRTVMLTGDRESNAAAVAKELGLDDHHAELLPDQKVAFAEQLLEQRGKDEIVGFVGDGINDAPVLMRADVGVSMGAMGSDAAIEAADVVIMDDNIAKLATARRIAVKTMQIVRQNILFSIGIKLIILLLGAFGYAEMWMAIFADVGVSVLAILNATRALHIK